MSSTSGGPEDERDGHERAQARRSAAPISASRTISESADPRLSEGGGTVISLEVLTDFPRAKSSHRYLRYLWEYRSVLAVPKYRVSQYRSVLVGSKYRVSSIDSESAIPSPGAKSSISESFLTRSYSMKELSKLFQISAVARACRLTPPMRGKVLIKGYHARGSRWCNSGGGSAVAFPPIFSTFRRVTNFNVVVLENGDDLL